MAMEQTDIKKKIESFQLKYPGIKINADTLQSFIEHSAKEDPVAWGMKHRVLKGKPYRFDLPVSDRNDKKKWPQHRPFLKRMMSDQAPLKSIQKSRQAGVSENSVTEVLWFLTEHPYTKAIYTFPTNPQMQTFSNTRIKPALEENDYMRTLLGTIDNVSDKEIGKGSYLIMRGTQSGRLGEGVDADAVFFDEKDRMVEKIEAAFEQSLSASAHGLLRMFSTPTLPGRGVNRTFEQSSKGRWFVKCESGHAQTLTFPDNIGFNRDLDPTEEYVTPGTCYFKCSHKDIHGNECPSAINRWGGEWVYEKPDRVKDSAGYHINQLSCVWISADEVIQTKIKYKFMDLFSNYVLGEPFSANDGLITNEALWNAIDTTRVMPRCRRNEYTSVVAGIDWGSINWVVVLGRRRDNRWEIADLFWVEDTKEVLGGVKQISIKLAPYKPDLIVADLGYGRDQTAYLLSVFPDKVYACTYTNTENDKTFNPKWSDNDHKVSVNRTFHLRNMTEEIKTKRLIMPGTGDDYKLLFNHIMNLVPMHEELEDPNKEDIQIIEKILSKGPDHFAHAIAYACLAGTKVTNSGFSYTFI